MTRVVGIIRKGGPKGPVVYKCMEEHNMSWNNRVVKHIYPMEVAYEIHEVFYNDDGSIMGATASPTAPSGGTKEELRESLERMLKSLDFPTLNYEDL